MILVCYSRHPSRVRITPWRELKFFFVNFETLCFRAVGWEETGSNPGGIENSNFFALVRPLAAQTRKFSSYLPCDTSTENFNKNIKIKKWKFKEKFLLYLWIRNINSCNRLFLIENLHSICTREYNFDFTMQKQLGSFWGAHNSENEVEKIDHLIVNWIFE